MKIALVILLVVVGLWVILEVLLRSLVGFGNPLIYVTEFLSIIELICTIENYPMSLSLTPATEKRITDQLARGRYESADELILAGLQLLEAREQRLTQLRQQITVGAEQIAQGRVTDGEQVFDRLLNQLHQ